MSFYLILFCLFSTSAFCYAYLNFQRKYVPLIFKYVCFLLLFIPAALRFGIGTDYKSYVDIFNGISTGEKISIEIGWIWLNLLVYKLGLNVQWIFIISGFVTYILLLKTDKKDFFIALIIYFMTLYLPSYNITRNCISISMFWYGFVCLTKEQKWQGLVVVLLSGLFHTSAVLVYLPLYFLMWFIPLNKKNAFILAIILYIVFAQFDLAGKLLEMPFLQETVYGKYSFSEKYAMRVKHNTGVLALSRLFLAFFAYLLCDEKNCTKKEFSAMSWLFLGLIISFSLENSIVIFRRSTTLFLVAHMAMGAIAFRSTERQSVKVGRISYLVLMFLREFCLSLINKTGQVIPYQSIFNAEF